MILSRYITKQVIVSTGIVLLVLLGMDLLINFLGEIHDIGQGSYSTTEAIVVALLRIPGDTYDFFPMSGLIGALMGLGALASNSELVAMRAAGFSVWQISKAVLLSALMILILITLIGEVIAPQSIQIANNYKQFTSSKGQTLSTLEGVWIRDKNSFIYINRVENGTRLFGVRWFTLNDKHVLQKTGAAKTAFYKNKAWILYDVAESIFVNDQRITTINVAQRHWRTSIQPKLLLLAQQQPNEMSLPKLYRYIHYREENQLQTSQYNLIFWQRLLQPFATLIMTFLAIPFIFGPLRHSTMGLRIVTGVAVGFSFYIITRLFGPFTLVLQLPALLGAITPLIIFLSIGIFLMRRVR